ncbi:MAG: hypothetical protein IJP44_04495 [Bacteroidales bacterium]|nr:hypothetical protein [Bacteroidales bacterium]
MKKPLLILMVLASMFACTKPKGYGNLNVNIGYSINGKILITDSLCYHNEAGNEFMITEIQWFISRLEFQNEQGQWIASDKTFYIDTNIPESQTLRIDSLPLGKYTKLRFTFGLDESDNRSGRFSDPPEANMFWPEPLGGGYHYMKLNGKFVNADDQLAPLNIHLGFCQQPNHFTVELPIDLTIAENAENQLDLVMVIDNWFRSPNLIDFNEWGSAIMQNQAAQQALKENGNDVFVTQNAKNQNDMAIKKEDILKGFNDFMQKAAPKPHFWRWENTKERIRRI